MRSLVFSIWVSVGKNVQSTIAALEVLSMGQYSTFKNGGSQVASFTLAGQTTTFNVPDGYASERINDLAYTAWRVVSGFTDDELETWLRDSAGELTDRTSVVFRR